MTIIIFCVNIVTCKVTMLTNNMNKYKNIKMNKYKNIKTLGEVSTILITTLAQQKRTIFSISEASDIVGVKSSQIRKLLYDLINKGWLKRIQKGLYLMIPLEAKEQYSEHPFIIGSKLVNPYYIGFWTMLNYYGYTEQIPNTIFIASTKQKRSINILGVNYNFIRTSPHKIFGLSSINMNENIIKVSDKEKTILDCLNHLEYCGGIIEGAKGVWNSRDEVNADKIIYYCKKMYNSSVAKRFGYLSEIFTIENQKELRNNLKNIINEGYNVLDPLLPKKGKYLSNWKLIINISKEDLLSWRSS